jgi:hypothetical protein
LPDVLSVCTGEAVEGHHLLPIALERLGRRSVAALATPGGELRAQALRFRPDAAYGMAVSSGFAKTFYVWKTRYGHLCVHEVRRVRQLEDENAWLKRLVADLTLDKHMLAEALRLHERASALFRSKPSAPKQKRARVFPSRHIFIASTSR